MATGLNGPWLESCLQLVERVLKSDESEMVVAFVELASLMDGKIGSNHLHEPIRRMSESITSSIGIKTASDCWQHKHRSTLRCRVGRISHYSDARRSMDSHLPTLGPIVDDSAWLRSLQLRNTVEELIVSEADYIADLEILFDVCHWNLYTLETLSGACHDTTFTGARHEICSRSSTFRKMSLVSDCSQHRANWRRHDDIVKWCSG